MFFSERVLLCICSNSWSSCFYFHSAALLEMEQWRLDCVQLPGSGIQLAASAFIYWNVQLQQWMDHLYPGDCPVFFRSSCVVSEAKEFVLDCCSIQCLIYLYLFCMGYLVVWWKFRYACNDSILSGACCFYCCIDGYII